MKGTKYRQILVSKIPLSPIVDLKRHAEMTCRVLCSGGAGYALEKALQQLAALGEQTPDRPSVSLLLPFVVRRMAE